jgi:hypothetical protein
MKMHFLGASGRPALNGRCSDMNDDPSPPGRLARRRKAQQKVRRRIARGPAPAHRQGNGPGTAAIAPLMWGRRRIDGVERVILPREAPVAPSFAL